LKRNTSVPFRNKPLHFYSAPLPLREVAARSAAGEGLLQRAP